MWFFQCVVLAASLCLALSMPAAGETFTGPAEFLHADTLVMDGERVRLVDIDGVEDDSPCFDGQDRTMPCGIKFRLEASEFLKDKDVTCETVGRYNYHAWIARCLVGEVNLSRYMAEMGWALPDGDCACTKVREGVAIAKAERRGAWAGAFPDPKLAREAPPPLTAVVTLDISLTRCMGDENAPDGQYCTKEHWAMIAADNGWTGYGNSELPDQEDFRFWEGCQDGVYTMKGSDQVSWTGECAVRVGWGSEVNFCAELESIEIKKELPVSAYVNQCATIDEAEKTCSLQIVTFLTVPQTDGTFQTTASTEASFRNVTCRVMVSR